MSAVVDDPAFAAESNLPVILGVLTTFFFLAAIVVCLRIYVRLFITHAFGVDDVLISISLVCSNGYLYLRMLTKSFANLRDG